MPKNQHKVRLGRAAPTIAVSDIQASCRFYQVLFGLEKTFENGSPVGFMILKRDDAEVHLTLARDHKAGAHNGMQLLVEGIADLYEACERQGVKIVKRIKDQEYGLRAFVLSDPDGNRIDVGERMT